MNVALVLRSILPAVAFLACTIFPAYAGQPAIDQKTVAESSPVEKALNGPVSLEFDGTELTKILKFLGNYSRVEIKYDIIKNEKRSSLRVPYIKLDSVPLRDALSAVLRSVGYSYEVREDAIHIIQAKNQEQAPLFSIVPVTSKPRPDYTALKGALQKPVSIAFEQQHVKLAVDKLAEAIGINMVVDARVVPPVDESVREGAPATNAYVSDGVVKAASFDAKPVAEVLTAILGPLHLKYTFASNFIWISSQRRIDTESFEDLETKIYEIRMPSDRFTKLVEFLDRSTQRIYEPVTDEMISWVIYNPSINQLMVRNTPSNLEAFERMLEALQSIDQTATPANNKA